MSTDFASLESFALGPFTIEPAAGLINLGDDQRQIQPKVMQLLLCLVANHGQIVSREFLLENVWPGVFVDGGALRRGIYFLRKSLTVDDDKTAIETLSKRGYRLNLAPDLNVETRVEDTLVAESADRTPVLDSAYRGLQVFDQEHSVQFFGRSTLTNQTCDAMARQMADGRAFVLLLGASGSGKSSLARAGVIPELVRRANERGDAPEVLVFQAGQGSQDILQQLATRLLGVFGESRPLEQDVWRFVEALSEDVDETVSGLVTTEPGETGELPCRAIILFDQFEQLLTSATLDSETRGLVFSVMYSLARSGVVQVLATLRNEFYPQLIAQESLRLLKGRHGIIDVTQPGAAEIADIVRKPAALAGLEFEQRADRARLDSVLIDEATTHANSLPLLQFALRELELGCSDSGTLTFEQYEKLGNLEGCLSQHAERVYLSLPKDSQGVLSRVFELLVTADPRNAGRLLKKSVPVSLIEQVPHAQALVDHFINARLMISFLDPLTEEPSVEIVHESVLAYWDRAREWAESSYADLRFRSLLGELSDKWYNDQRSEAYLLRDGKLLVDAEKLLARDGFFDDKQQAFVQASLARSNRTVMLKRGVVAMLVGLLGLSMFMWSEARSSAVKAKQALSRANSNSEFMASIFADANPANTGRDVMARELLYLARDRLKREPKKDPLVQADTLRSLGEAMLKMNDYEESEAMFAEALENLDVIRAEDPKLAVAVLLEQAGLNREKSRFDKADQFAADASEIANETGDSFLIARCENMRGLIDQGLRTYDQAEAHFTRAVAELAKVDESTEVVTRFKSRLQNNVGLNLLLSRDYDSAEGPFRQSMALLESVGLGESADYTLTMGNLATLRRFQRRHEESAEIYEEALEITLRFYDTSHPDVISLLTNLASAQMSLGRYADVLNTTSRALSVDSSRGVYGTTAFPQLRMRRIVAQQLGGVESSEQDISEAVEAAKDLAREFGEFHYTVIETQMAVNAARWERGGLFAGALERHCEDTRRLIDYQTENQSANPRVIEFFERLQRYLINCP